MTLAIDELLYAFQLDDVLKLTSNERYPNALIASEMGTGKTYEGVAIDQHRREKAKGKTLTISPLAVCDTWDRHFTRLTDLRVMQIDPKDRIGSWREFVRGDYDVFSAHWDVLRLMPELSSFTWLHVIADECHRASGRKTQQTRALKKIRTLYKTGLSGTPTTGFPDKLWSILNWLYPKMWSSYWSFYKEYVEFEIVYPQGYHKVIGPKNESKLLKLIEPYYARHLKKERCCEHHPFGVTPELPDKYYSDPPVYVDLLPIQRRAYDQMKKEMIAWVGQQEAEEKPLVAPVVIAQLMRLQQFAVAYAEVGSDGSVRLAEPSSKLDALMRILRDNPTKQIVVFSQFRQLIELLSYRLDNPPRGMEKISHGLYTGTIPKADRDQAVQRFQAGDLQVMAGTISAGGVGIDLYSASTVVFLDRDWSPALNKQAEDRLWRIGQKNAVEVIDIIANKTVDLGRKQQIDTKWSWVRRILGDI